MGINKHKENERNCGCNKGNNRKMKKGKRKVDLNYFGSIIRKNMKCEKVINARITM